ncbi:MAG: hypothetical protein AAGN46_18275 [Acidobacteriota bacterium]
MTPHAVHYLPIVTTVLSALFLVALLRHWNRRRSGPHLLWWAFGMFTYGLGTGLESTITLFGNSVGLTKAWYIAGALLGGYPLAQGSVYLLMRRRTAHWLTGVSLPFLAVAALCVVLSPVRLEELLPHKPAGSVLAWEWVRWMTPVINLYAVVFLIGGAILSALRFARMRGEGIDAAGNGARALGNALIAFGALLPGIGGTMAKAGVVEALYVGELVGLLFIFAGYRACATAGAAQPARVSAGEEGVVDTLTASTA